MINRAVFFLRIDLLHSYVKQDYFLMCLDTNLYIIYLIDFGLVK